MKRSRTIAYLILSLLLLGGMVGEVWATKVTYHILTLPIDPTVYDYNMKAEITGKRLEAVTVVVDNQTTVELPAHYKSPLATGFTYYKKDHVTKSAAAEQLFANSTKIKGFTYEVDPEATPVAEGTTLTTDEYYVVYTYNSSNPIAKLDGTVRYNIGVSGKGFMAYNRGRNNRPAVLPTGKVNPEMLASEDFMKVDVTGTKIGPYWSSGDNKNPKAKVQSQFHFMFKFEGVDPYNIIIRTAYQKDSTYIEKDEGSGAASLKDKFVYKWYKGGSLFASTTNNAYIASDEHILYNIEYDSGLSDNPTDLTAGEGIGYYDRPGYYHGQSAVIWNSFALLKNSNDPTSNTGYVFMSTRTVDDSGKPYSSPYYLIEKDNCNNLQIAQKNLTAAASNFTIEGIYPIQKVTFKVPTSFYAVEPTAAHIVSAADWVSQYTVEHDDIETKYLPDVLKRKYCDFKTKFYKDAARTQEITRFSQAEYDPDEGYQVYLDYSVSASLPYKAIKPAASYTDATWSASTWYELMDVGSVQADGKKLKYNAPDFLNNGGDRVFEKTSEFAFLGDPYELRVVYRGATSGATPSYVGAAGDTPASGTLLTASTSATAGYSWDMPLDDTEGSFLLRLYNGDGWWNWDTSTAGNTVAYSTTAATRVKVEELPKRTFTYKIVDKSGRIAVTASASQTIFSQLSLASIPSIIVSPFLVGETVTFYETFDNGSGAGTGKSRTDLSVPITETPNDDAVIYVKYTTGSMDSKSIKLSEEQEFNVVLNGQYIYYDPSGNTIKSNIAPTSEELTQSNYLWKLRNRDPYAMLIDNLGAREDTEFNVSGLSEHPDVYDDDGTLSTPTRQKGAWVKLESAGFANDKALAFTSDRADAQRFIAKMSVQTGVYEVMVATGDGVDASTTYYHIGRPSEHTVKIYDQVSHAHGDDVLKFHLEQTIGYIYHLIDKSNHQLLTMTSQSPDLALPADYQSPLVATYHFYDATNISVSGDEYTVKDPLTELANIHSLDATYEEPVASTAEAYNKAAAGCRHDAISEKNMTDLAKLLSTTGNHYFSVGGDYYVVNVIKPFYNNIYVTYDVNDLIGFNNSGRIDDHPYLLKFLNPLAQGYYLEDGSDKLTSEKLQAIYPYCNGDGNLNIYGQRMRDEQMDGGSSTRPRWVWFFESTHNDPYHVKIHSRSTISYNGVSHPTYLQTYAVHYYQDADPSTTHIVTGGFLAGAASADPTEYMILGEKNNYKLLTTHLVDGEHRMVTSLEQYWKTYNMAKLHVLGIASSTDSYSDDKSTWTVPSDPSSYRAALEAKGWHSYDAYANATRWNGYNNLSSGHEKKVVEELEHWFQTFDMGDGSFTVESADIPPVLVLLDSHGWEIMRRPLPNIATYPEGKDELAALRAYDSPMVKEYKFYSNATKASGCHKYTLRLDNSGNERDQIKLDGVHFTSHSLAVLPPPTATGVVSSGVINDQYVTYTVKEEYLDSYTYNCVPDDATSTYTETGTPSKFLVMLNQRFLRDNGSDEGSSYFSKPIHEASNPPGGNMYDAILNPSQVTVSQVSTNVDESPADGVIDDINLWYIQPNLNIDKEMGIKWGTSDKITDPEPLSEFGTKKKYKDITGFDPYNIQLRNVYNGKYVTSHITTTALSNGIHQGSYTGENYGLTLETWVDVKDRDTATPTMDGDVVLNEGYDHTNLQMTNQTFMAVSDANGNMQLMPRFDHTRRVNLVNDKDKSLTTLQPYVNHTIKASADNNGSMGLQTVFFVRPQVMEYHIIDNDGYEALRYKRAGDYYPDITAHFISPLAKDFTYYKDLTMTDGVYTEIPDKADISDKEITGSFASKGLNAGRCDVFVRYSYDEDVDREGDKILQGQWFTVKLDGKDVQGSGTVVTAGVDEKGTGVSLFADAATPTKPATIGASDKTWQWKFLAAPTDPSSAYYASPDPYAIRLFNRNANYATTLTEPSPMKVGIKVDGHDRFALLSHPDGDYALAVCGLGTYNYSFLNGAAMTESVAATTAEEAGFTLKDGTISADAQLQVFDDVTHNYTYKVINNALNLAVQAPQADDEADTYHYAPHLPDAAQTKLLNLKDYTYYGSVDIDNKGTTDNPADDTYDPVENTKLFTLYGLYDDVVYVRYAAYDPSKTPFKVPNKKAVVGSKVTKDDESQDVSMHIDGSLPYNIIWENDNMMQSTDNTAISDGGSQPLSGTEQYVWYFEGNDPYALKIKHKGGSYVAGSETMVAESSAPTFMLLNMPDYDYGILQMTGSDGRLTGFGATTTTGAPTKFVIFGLSTGKLFYHLVINTTNQHTEIPYRSGDKTYTAESALDVTDTLMIAGTTQRDLTNYPIADVDAGAISIGDDFKVPNLYYRPNCTFDFYIAGVYDDEARTIANSALNNKYMGLKLTNLMSDADLIGKSVVVNVVYKFNQELATNNGLGFVTSTDNQLWYTLETMDSSTPYLAHHTISEGLRTVAGRTPHYTNDYLWTPLGDVYGFKMFNRYELKNNKNNDVMSTADLNSGTSVTMQSDNANAVYELLKGNVDGNFRVHPVANTGTMVYVVREGDALKLSTTPMDWTFGLDMAMLEPYKLGAGNVGGLTDEGVVAYDAAVATGKVTEIQKVVYDDANIVKFATGYYRLHSQPGVPGVSTMRYASGYLHDTEATHVSGGIPMHFYSKEGVSTTFGEGGLATGFTVTPATRGDIPVPATENDPSTVFYIQGSETSNTTINTVTLSTQGLNVVENKMSSTSPATTYNVMDIGAAVVLIYTEDGGGSRTYLNYDQSSAIYDLKYNAGTVESTKWCMEPANRLGLNVTTNNGGDGYYYATFYAPFDVLLPAADGDPTYDAYICTKWYNNGVHPAKVPANGAYAEGRFVPAGTPVIIRTSDDSRSVTLTLPSTSPSTAQSCVFTGTCLEQMLTADASHDVYTFGLPFTSTVTMDPSTGQVTAPLAEQATTGVGFYINANPNKENDALQSLWLRNNRYVQHNKIYYREVPSPSGARRLDAPQFVPVLFDDDQQELAPDGRWTTAGDNHVYDLSGRCVATPEQVQDGTWWQQASRGIYILNGRKLVKR